MPEAGRKRGREQAGRAVIPLCQDLAFPVAVPRVCRWFCPTDLSHGSVARSLGVSGARPRHTDDLGRWPRGINAQDLSLRAVRVVDSRVVPGDW